MNTLMTLIIVGLITFQLPTRAGELKVPNTFTAGSPAISADVNSNFTAVEAAVNGNAADITTVLNALAALEENISTLEANIASLQTDNVILITDNALLQNLITEVIPYLAGGTDEQGQPTVFFSGVNVHVNNGQNTTGFVNGTGNLIVGYDEVLDSSFSYCTARDNAGSGYQNQTDCEIADGTWGFASQKSGSHNLILGRGHHYTQSGSLVSGFNNVVNSVNSSVIAGVRHLVSGVGSTVTGGTNNIASGAYSNVSGGSLNLASGNTSSVTGGSENTAIERYSSISGGQNNVASGDASSVSGGLRNEASGVSSSVSGGAFRTATDFTNWAAGTLSEDF
ncbi:MAG: hypothetical protein KUG78_20255 [Kangiellaceae bacterium]|nr:hypothetical protein [Kangiellaceae bacterium]